MFFLFEKNSPNQIILASEDIPTNFEIGCKNVISKGSSIYGINWDNVDFEITSSTCPDDFVEKPMKYSFIEGLINEDFENAYPEIPSINRDEIVEEPTGE